MELLEVRRLRPQVELSAHDFFEALQRTPHRQVFERGRPVLDDGPNASQQTHVAVHELPHARVDYFDRDASAIQSPAVDLRDAAASEDRSYR